jgi:hypothetical protein
MRERAAPKQRCSALVSSATPGPPGPPNKLRIRLGLQHAATLDKTKRLDRVQLARADPPSALTLGGLLHHLALAEEDWMEIHFLGQPDRGPLPMPIGAETPTGSSVLLMIRNQNSYLSSIDMPRIEAGPRSEGYGPGPAVDQTRWNRDRRQQDRL